MEYSDTTGGQVVVPGPVTFQANRGEVDRTVQFNRESELPAVEVHNQAVDHHLSLESQAETSATPQDLPDTSLGGCWTTPHLAR